MRPFFIAGVADYRYSPAPSRKSRALGASVGPGLIVTLVPARATVVLQARFHSSFDRVAAVSSQEFVSVMLGLEFGL